MSKLFNNLFEIGHFPDHWKIAHVTPIFKRVGSKNIKYNYRPISILPSLSKVAESVIHERLLSHCVFHNIITERQAAYLKGDSTITQLLYLVHQIRKKTGALEKLPKLVFWIYLPPLIKFGTGDFYQNLSKFELVIAVSNYLNHTCQTENSAQL